METNGNGRTNLVKPHILLIGLALVAFNSYWCLMGTEVWHSTQLTIALAVLQCRFYASCLRTRQSTAPAVPAASGDVGSRLTNHLCHGRDGVNDQRTYHDGVPHPRPHAYISVRNSRK